MYVCIFRFGFSCFQSLFLLSLIYSFIVYGFAKGSDKKITEKIFVNNFPKEDEIKILDATREKTTMLNKSKSINLEKVHRSDIKKQKIVNVRQKRNAVAGDEDLFEFMVRIANTPVEWERIRRVLSRIKSLEDRERNHEHSNNIANEMQTVMSKVEYQTSTSRSRDLASESQNTNRRPVTGTPIAKLVEIRKTDKWPSTEWIKNLIRNATTDNDDYYNDEDDYLSEEAYEDDDFRENSLMDGKWISSPNRTKSYDNETSQMIIPNAELPNFVYRRVISNASSHAENSAYIAVSVVAPSMGNHTQLTAKLATNTGTDMGDDSWYENKYRNLEQLQTRRRHSRRKYQKK